MTPERENELQNGYSSITEKEWSEGWRFCIAEWDGLLVNINKSLECKNCGPDECKAYIHQKGINNANIIQE
jgi:hypothetical protein